MGIQPLSDKIRQILYQAHSEPIPFSIQGRDTVIPIVDSTSDEWISLPFVQDGMIVKTVDLANLIAAEEGKEHDVVRIQYKEGLEAFLDYPDDSTVDDESKEEEIKNDSDEKEGD